MSTPMSGSDLWIRKIAREETEALLKEIGFSWSKDGENWSGFGESGPGTLKVEMPSGQGGEMEPSDQDDLISDADEEMAVKEIDQMDEQDDLLDSSEESSDLLLYAKVIVPENHPFPGTCCPVCGSDNVDVGGGRQCKSPNTWASVQRQPGKKVVIGHSVSLECGDCGATGHLSLDARWSHVQNDDQGEAMEDGECVPF